MGLQMRKIPYGYTFYPVMWKGEAYAVDLLWSRDGIVSGYVMVHICQYIEKKYFCTDILVNGCSMQGKSTMSTECPF